MRLPPPKYVKVEPLSQSSRRVIIVRCIFFILVVLLAVLFIMLLYPLTLQPGTDQLELKAVFFFFSAAFILMILLGIWGIIFTINRMRILKNFESKRQIIASPADKIDAKSKADQIPLIEPQPQASTANIVLPISVQLRPHLPRVLLAVTRYLAILILVILLIFLLAYSITVLFFPIFPMIFPMFEFVLVPLLVFFACFGLLLFLGYVQLSTGKVEVTDEGIATYIGIKRRKHTHYVGWHEARLFAAEGMYLKRPRKNAPVLFYELSSERDIVRWIAPCSKYPGNTPIITKPAYMTLDEYNDQIQKILSVIAVKTSLPLYDLR